MYRRLFVPALALVVTASCTVQPTPREYIDRQVPPADVQQTARDALTGRISRLVQALQAGDVDAARATLAPAEDVIVIGPGDEQRFSGVAQLDAILDLLAATGDATLELRDVRADVSPRGTTGWFEGWMELRHPELEPIPVRVTGVYVERDAAWELRQAHVSFPTSALTQGSYPPARPAPTEGG